MGMNSPRGTKNDHGKTGGRYHSTSGSLLCPWMPRLAMGRQLMLVLYIGHLRESVGCNASIRDGNCPESAG